MEDKTFEKLTAQNHRLLCGANQNNINITRITYRIRNTQRNGKKGKETWWLLNRTDKHMSIDKTKPILNEKKEELRHDECNIYLSLCFLQLSKKPKVKRLTLEYVLRNLTIQKYFRFTILMGGRTGSKCMSNR